MRPERHRRLVAAVAAAGLALALLACSPATRLRTLGFFFDGVPGAADTGGDATTTGSLRLAAAVTPRPTPMPIVSTHKPVAERQCRQCHTQGGRYEPIAMQEKLCDKCHRQQREREGWNHGPINLGSCLPCHRAHESPWPHLLDKPQPDVCLICHEVDLEGGRAEHRLPQAGRCTQCHDPHRQN